MTTLHDKLLKMMRVLIGGAACICVLSSIAAAQQTAAVQPTTQEQEALTAWTLMQEDTDLYDDAKESWVIQDENVIRGILLSLRNRELLWKKNGTAHVSVSTPAEVDSIISVFKHSNKGSISARKRYQSDELESISLKTSDTAVYSITDPVYLRSLLGSTIYSLIAKKEYSYSEYSPNFDVLIQMGKPELLLLTTAPDGYGKWYVSLFGSWGVDEMSLPLWAKGSGTIGLRAKHRSFWLPRWRDYDLFSINLGWEQPINFTIPAGSILENMFKQPKLIGTSSSVYAKVLYNPHSGIWGGGYDEFGLEASIATIPRGNQEFPARTPETFYSIQNYFTVSARACQLSELVDVGIGYTWHDLDHVSWRRDTTRVRKIDPTQYNSVPFVELGISKYWGFLQFSLSGRFNYDVTDEFGYLVWSGRVMITNTFGVDFQYHNTISTTVPPWQTTDYMVISPVIRINF